MLIALFYLIRGQLDRKSSQNDLNSAIRLAREALKLYQLNHPERGRLLLDLAASLGLRYDRTGSNEDLSEAIRLEREALKRHPPGHHNRSRSLLNLAASLAAMLRSCRLAKHGGWGAHLGHIRCTGFWGSTWGHADGERATDVGLMCGLYPVDEPRPSTSTIC